MELKDTIHLMASPNYKDRFLAEYWQVKIRYVKLKEMCQKWDKGELEFVPTCDRGIYSAQLANMFGYLIVLEQRSHLENIDLKENMFVNKL